MPTPDFAALAHQAIPTRGGTLVYEHDEYTKFDVTYRLAGRYYPQTLTSPAEYPDVGVTRCELLIGEFRVVVPFADLPSEIQAHIEDACAQQEFA